MLCRNKPTAIGEPFVRKKSAVFAIGRQRTDYPVVFQGYERIIVETVAMIVHVSAQVEESGIFSISHEIVPLGSHVGRISNYFYGVVIHFQNQVI